MSLHPPVLFLDGRPNPVASSLEVPLVGTKGYRIFLQWLARMNVDINKAMIEYSFASELSNPYPNEVIVTLGSEAAFHIEKFNKEREEFTPPIPSFPLPHPTDDVPSEELGRLLSRCKRFIYSTPVK